MKNVSNFRKSMVRLVQKQDFSVLTHSSDVIFSISQKFLTPLVTDKLFVAIKNVFSGVVVFLENPIYIKDRTTQRMIRTNRILKHNGNRGLPKAVATA